jgi:hypothetical protein
MEASCEFQTEDTKGVNEQINGACKGGTAA